MVLQLRAERADPWDYQAVDARGIMGHPLLQRGPKGCTKVVGTPD